MERFFSVIHIVCPAPSRLAFDQGSGRLVLCVLGPWSCEVRVSGEGLSTGPEEGTSRSTLPRAQGTSQEQAAQNRFRSFHFPRFVYPYTLSLACSVWALYLTSTSPTRHAPRRSRDFPRHTPSQASNDVQCHVGEGHPGNVQKVHGQCM
jgi:hypothetical protein